MMIELVAASAWMMPGVVAAGVVDAASICPAPPGTGAPSGAAAGTAVAPVSPW